LHAHSPSSLILRGAGKEKRGARPPPPAANTAADAPRIRGPAPKNLGNQKKQASCLACPGLIDVVFLFEMFDAASAFGKALTTGIERMAFRADFDANRSRFRRTAFEFVAARTRNFHFMVFRMNPGFHSTFTPFCPGYSFKPEIVAQSPL
jgi:hypothetical protein